jgi:chromosome segregation ATPase
MSPSEYQQLVEFLGGQFTTIDQRFAAMDGRFEALEAAQAAFRQEVFGHFDELYRRLDRLDQEYLAITQALRRIEGLLADEQTRREVLERTVAELKERVALLQARIDDVERRLRP